MFRAGVLLLSVCSALAARKIKQRQQSSVGLEQGTLDAMFLPQWDDAAWREPCWGAPDPEQQLGGDVLKSICARLHQNASFLVFGLGRDSALWYKNAINKIVFLENHADWLQFQEKDVVEATRIVTYTSDATKYKKELHDESKLAALYESLPSDIKEAHWDMILVDSPMGMETNNLPAWMNMMGARHLSQMHPLRGTPGRTQSVYAAKRLAHNRTIIYVDDFHRTVEHESAQVLLQPGYRNLHVFPSGHRDENGIPGRTAMLLREDALGTSQRAHNAQSENIRLSMEKATETKVLAMAEKMSERMSEHMEKAFEAKLQESLSRASKDIMKRGIAKGVGLTAEVVRSILQQMPGKPFLETFEDRIKQLQL